MATAATQGVPRKSLETLYRSGVIANLTDAQLIERTRAGGEAAADAAFGVLVERHGPMVLRVCRAVLRDDHEAHDVYQATFLVLVRRLGSIRNQDSVAPWLFAVAHRLSMRARVDAARRGKHEALAAIRSTATTELRESFEDLSPLHDEIARLPEAYRAVIVLCYLEGLTTEAAAARLGCPRGTVLSRLARARGRLRRGLDRRGVTFQESAPIAGLLAAAGKVAVPVTLSDRVVHAAAEVIKGRNMADVVSAAVAGAVERERRAWLLDCVMRGAAVLAAVAVATAGAGIFATDDPAPRDVSPASPKAQALPSPVAQYERLIAEFREFRKRVDDDREDSAKPNPERDERRRKLWPLENQFTGRFLELARAHPRDPVAFDALAWVVTFGFSSEESDAAAAILARDHGRDARLWPVCEEMSRAPISLARGTLLRAVRDQNADRATRGRAALALAKYLIDELTFVRLQRTGLRPWQAQFLTRSRLDAIRAQDPETLVREIEATLKTVLRDYADVRPAELTTAPNLHDDARNIDRQPQDKERAEGTLGAVAGPLLDELRHLDVGHHAPEIEGTDADGKTLKLSDYRGKVVVLTFSGNWCGPCRMMYPHERELVKKYADRPFALLSVNTDETIETLRNSIRSGEITWRCWWGPEGREGVIPTQWNVKGWPTVFLLDRQGVIRSKFVGYIGTEKSGPNLERAIEPLLDEVPPAKEESR